MAYFGVSNLECACGHDEFEEVKLVVIKPEYSSASKDMVGDIPIPGRLLNSEKIAYKCTKCSKLLSI